MLEAARQGSVTGDLELRLRFLEFFEGEMRYGHLSTAISPLGLPSQVRLDWSQLPQYPHYYDYYYGSCLLMMRMIMFPYGYTFEKDRLVQILLCEPGMSYFDSQGADQYISYLVHRETITKAAANSRRSNADEVGTWKWNVNQLQYQLLTSKSAEMGIAFTSDTLNLLVAASATNHGEEASWTPRRLALHHDDPDIPSLLQNVDLSQTRSLAVSGGVVTISVPLDRFVNLVVLDVEGWENFEDEDLLRMCRSKMFFLVYLSIRNTTVSKLPLEIKELRSLEVLDASYTKVTELPFKDFEATRLRRLDVRGTPIRQLMLKQILGLQHSLESLLLDEGIIISAETATSLRHDIQRFRRLHTLPTVDLSKQPASFINTLGDLGKLRVLAVTWSFHQSSDINYCEALLSSIRKLKWLKSLTIHCGLGCSMEFLASLSGPPEKLEKFKVTVGRFAGVPQWFDGLEHLSFLQITVCKLEYHDLQMLKDIPQLECLILGLDFIPKEAIVINYGGLHALDRLSIDCQVPCLTFESGAMSKLTYLQLNFRAYPTYLIIVPLCISNLYRLTEVALCYNVSVAVQPQPAAVQRTGCSKSGLEKKAFELADLCSSVDVTVVCAGPGGGAPDDRRAGVIERYSSAMDKRTKPKTPNYLNVELGKQEVRLAKERQEGPKVLASPGLVLNNVDQDGQLMKVLFRIQTNLLVLVDACPHGLIRSIIQNPDQSRSINLNTSGNEQPGAGAVVVVVTTARFSNTN
ncbi:hypothetical protein HU200_005895 [Digitaria exilis]|uniref:Disease resistance R13L4/SHOC-2-like LRR domain-containing protein n=1 Tax=Digitaria exilis TaxID=1010633 RepID=A0A835FS90_9POAL|nr:hypothetical protein HU200_005895 [Digitaria exilis]